MARALDGEPDLYPPDVDELTPELREQRKRAIIGTFLLAFGCGLLLERIVGYDLDFFFLSFGIAVLVGWLQVPRYQAFALGSIITGFGLNEFVESALAVRFESALGWLFLAAGFFAVYVRYPTRARWAIAPAVVMGLVAVADFGVGLIGLIPGSIGLVPLALISAGAVLLFRERLPKRAVKVMLIVAAVLCVSSLSSSVDEIGGRFGDIGTQEIVFAHRLKAERSLALSLGSGDVEVVTDPDVQHAQITADVDRDRPRPSIKSLEDLPPDTDVAVRVPPGTDLDIRTTDGNVKIIYPKSDLTRRSTEIDLFSEDDDVEFLGEDREGRYRKRAAGDALLSIKVQTTEGEIELEAA